MLSHSIKFSESHTKEKGGDWLTRGELEQRCGVEEATRKIDEGKYEKDVDSDDETVYRLKKKSTAHKKIIDSSMTLSAKNLIGKGHADQVANMLMGMFSSTSASSSPGGGTLFDRAGFAGGDVVAKRPAAFEGQKGGTNGGKKQKLAAMKDAEDPRKSPSQHRKRRSLRRRH